MINKNEKQSLEQDVLNALNESRVDEDILDDSQLTQTEGGKNVICFNFKKGCGASSSEDEITSSDGRD